MPGLSPRRNFKVDVHTARVFTNGGKNGNWLGVVAPAETLDARIMQKVAKILGFSETSFVFPLAKTKADYRVRFFTPEKEIPFAGHPSIGTLFVLRKLGRLPQKMDYTQSIGTRSVKLRAQDDGRIYMDQGRGALGRRIGRDDAAKLLGLPEEQIAGEPQTVSTGLPHLLIPLVSQTALLKARISLQVYDMVRKQAKADCIMPFFVKGNKARCRMFAPAYGVKEDPATGSGCGPLASFLFANNDSVPPASKGMRRLEVLQGSKKLSRLYAVIHVKNGKQVNVEVGGECRMGKMRTVLVKEGGL
jgi:trans-2,3-dihydro-3-hydroxyanthranilate isomerase